MHHYQANLQLEQFQKEFFGYKYKPKNDPTGHTFDRRKEFGIFLCCQRTQVEHYHFSLLIEYYQSCYQ